MKDNSIKTVNIYPRFPIYTVTPSITSNVMNQKMCIGDIRACLMRQAKVEEVLPDGKTVRLDLNTLELDTQKRLAEEEAARKAQQNTLASAAKDLTKVKKDLQDAIKAKTDAENTIATQKAQIESLNDNLDKANKEISSLKLQAKDKGADTELASKLTNAEAKLAKKTSELDVANKTLASIKTEKSKLESDLKAATKNIDSLGAKVTEKDQQIEAYKKENEELKAQLEELTKPAE